MLRLGICKIPSLFSLQYQTAVGFAYFSIQGNLMDSDSWCFYMKTFPNIPFFTMQKMMENKKKQTNIV